MMTMIEHDERSVQRAQMGTSPQVYRRHRCEADIRQRKRQTPRRVLQVDDDCDRPHKIKGAGIRK